MGWDEFLEDGGCRLGEGCQGQGHAIGVGCCWLPWLTSEGAERHLCLLRTIEQGIFPLEFYPCCSSSTCVSVFLYLFFHPLMCHSSVQSMSALLQAAVFALPLPICQLLALLLGSQFSHSWLLSSLKYSQTVLTQVSSSHPQTLPGVSNNQIISFQSSCVFPGLCTGSTRWKAIINSLFSFPPSLLFCGISCFTILYEL